MKTRSETFEKNSGLGRSGVQGYCIFDFSGGILRDLSAFSEYSGHFVK